MCSYLPKIVALVTKIIGMKVIHGDFTCNHTVIIIFGCGHMADKLHKDSWESPDFEYRCKKKKKGGVCGWESATELEDTCNRLWAYIKLFTLANNFNF